MIKVGHRYVLLFLGRKDIVERLLKTDIDVNVTTPLESSALHFAAMNGYADIAKLLLQAGAKADFER